MQREAVHLVLFKEHGYAQKILGSARLQGNSTKVLWAKDARGYLAEVHVERIPDRFRDKFVGVAENLHRPLPKAYIFMFDHTAQTD